MHGLKNLRSATLGWKNIGNRKSEFEKKTVNNFKLKKKCTKKIF